MQFPKADRHADLRRIIVYMLQCYVADLPQVVRGKDVGAVAGQRHRPRSRNARRRYLSDLRVLCQGRDEQRLDDQVLQHAKHFFIKSSHPLSVDRSNQATATC